MIHDPEALRTLLEEIVEWNLEQRRQYLKDLEKAFGRNDAEQIKRGLTQLWAKRRDGD